VAAAAVVVAVEFFEEEPVTGFVNLSFLVLAATAVAM